MSATLSPNSIIRRVCFAVSLVILSACSDTLAPAKTAFQQVTAGLSNILSCDVSWSQPVDGLWSDAARWSTGAVPTSTQNVCITAEGAYTVIARDMKFAKNITIGGPGRPAQPSLWIEGTRFFSTGFSMPADLIVGEDVENYGHLRLTDVANNGAPATLSLGGTLRNLAGARFESVFGVGNSRLFRGSLVNDGTVDVQWSIVFDKANATYVNNGVFAVSDVFAAVEIRNNATFTQAGGSMTLAGRFIQPGGSFTWAGGASSGANAAELHNIVLTIPGGSTATGTLSVREASSLTGNISAAQQIDIFAWRPNSTGFSFPAVLTTTGATTNYGVVRLTGHETHATLDARNGGFTNALSARFEITGANNGGRNVLGSVTNYGEIRNAQWDMNFNLGTFRNNAPGWINGPQNRIVFDQGLTFFGDGVIDSYIVNHGVFNVGHSPGHLDLRRDFAQSNLGLLNFELGGSPANPGVDFDRITIGEGMYMNGTLRVTAANAACVDGGKTFVIMTSRNVGNSDFHTVVNGIAGRTVTTEKGTTDYKLHVGGPACPPPDASPPVITPTVTGTLGLNGWYTSNVGVTWTVTDTESPVTSSTGCSAGSVTTDHAGTTFTCSATSAGGTSSQSVTIKRDATAPRTASDITPAPRPSGWYNTDVTLTLSATDAMSGLDGPAGVVHTFTVDGANQNFFHTFVDKAGNQAVNGLIEGVNLDKTPPVVTVTRTPAPGPDGWNETNVTVTYSATDALSGVSGAASFEQVFTLGENQGGSHTFTDVAGNSATGSISGINIRTPPPPPPPPPAPGSIGSATPSEIWPPNNKMTAVRVTMCTGVVSYTLRSVTNNETGAADVEGWALGTADLNGFVRAARNGGGAGRTYTLIYDTIGANGSASSCTVTVTVAHDQGKKK